MHLGLGLVFEVIWQSVDVVIVVGSFVGISLGGRSSCAGETVRTVSAGW